MLSHGNSESELGALFISLGTSSAVFRTTHQFARHTQKGRYRLAVVRVKILYSSVQQPEEKQGNLWLGFLDNLIFTSGTIPVSKQQGTLQNYQEVKPSTYPSPPGQSRPGQSDWLLTRECPRRPGQVHIPKYYPRPHASPLYPPPPPPRPVPCGLLGILPDLLEETVTQLLS